MSRLARALPLCALLLLVAASPVSADHCNAITTVGPVSGPPGTTFVFRTMLADESRTLRLYRDGQEVKSVVLRPGDHVYRFKTNAADVGRWTAMAGEPEGCHSKLLSFLVGGLPGTGTDIRPTEPSSSAAILALAGLVGGWVGLAVGSRRRKRAHPD